MNKQIDIPRSLEQIEELYQKHKTQTKNCLSVARILEMSCKNFSSLSPEEMLHINKCRYCYNKLERLYQRYYQRNRDDYKVAAGPGPLERSNFTMDYLGKKMQIVFEKNAKSYRIYIVADIPVCLTALFLREGKELYRTEISRESNDIPLEKIENWDVLKLSKCEGDIL